MFCSKCGSEVSTESAFCAKCGSKIENQESGVTLPNGFKVGQQSKVGEGDQTEVDTSGNLSWKETVGILGMVFVIVVVLAMYKNIPESKNTKSTSNTQSRIISDAEKILKDSLKAPSSYRRKSAKIMWSGKNKEGHNAYVARIEYDAQNAFGANLRGCNFIAFSKNNGELRFRTRGSMDKCDGGGMFSEKQMVEVLVSGNFS